MSSNFHPDGTLFIVSGPSGAGKTTLINRVREQLEPIGITLYFSVSHTTRKPRVGEIDGISYHFVPTETFEAMARRGHFHVGQRVQLRSGFEHPVSIGEATIVGLSEAPIPWRIGKRKQHRPGTSARTPAGACRPPGPLGQEG